MPAPQPARRFARRSPKAQASLDRLADAIHTLHQASAAGDPFLVARGLEVLTEHLGGSLATLVTVGGTTMDTRWWHPESPEALAPEPIRPLCEWMASHGERVLVIQDMDTGPHLNGAEELRLLPHRAALASTLHRGGGVQTLLFVFFDQPRAFSRMDFALLETVGGFLGRMLESEDLKQSVARLEDALAITQAVMQDSAIRDPDTDLPNRHYLEVWEKALLGLEDRPTSLVVAECRFRLADKATRTRLRQAAESVRASDLVVRIGQDRFQVILRQTPRHRADLQLHRFLSHLGGAPMGATLWIPGPQGLPLASCGTLLQEAVEESLRMVIPNLVWRLPAPAAEAPAPPEPPGKPTPWQPPVIRRA